MRFQKFSLYSTFIVLILVVVNLASHTAVAQTPEATTAVTMVATNQPLTLIWQSEFSAEGVLIIPSDIAVDDQGNSYVSMQGEKHLKKYDSNGKLVARWANTGTDDGELNLTAGLSLDTQGNIYVADFFARRIEKFDSNGNYLMQWTTSQPSGPASVIVDKQGNAYVDSFGFCKYYIQKFDSSGKLVTQWGTRGTDDGQFMGIGPSGPEDIALDADGNVYVADRLNHRIQKFDPNGKFLAKFGGDNTDGNGLFDQPLGVAVDTHGNIYVVDVGSKFLKKLDSDGKLIAQWSTNGGELAGAAIVAVDNQDNLYLFAVSTVPSKAGGTEKVVLLKKFRQP